MPSVVECVPNFSEGRDRVKIKQITDAIEAVSGVRLLNVEPGADTNRTVVTFVGSPEAVSQAAFAGFARATQLIDMTKHTGAHPRLGATDVCPFIPVEGVTMADCVALARAVGERVARELHIPVYLYEEAASRPERRNLADVRRGEWEGLDKKLADPAWQPDFGPAVAHPTAGASIIGAREFLIAYNIDLNSSDKGHATDIAMALREKGRVARSGNTNPYYSRGKKLFYRDGAYPCGSCDYVGITYESVRAHCANVHDYDLDALLRANDLSPPDILGKNVYRPGRFKACKAIGWYVDEYKRAQISINLTNYKITPPHEVFDEAVRLAEERGLRVTGSEVVGVIPMDALLGAGQHYLRKQGRTLGHPLMDILRAGAQSLGLSDAAPFDIEAKVLGLPTIPGDALVRRTVLDFTDEVSRDSPAPGGGSVAALAGALAAALASMVANLTHGKEGTEERDAELSRIAEAAQKVKDRLMLAVDADSQAFNGYMAAMRMPQSNAEEKAARARRMQEELRNAIDVPLRTAEESLQAMRLAREVAGIGNPNSLSDGAVGVQLGFAGVRGGLWNVLINLKDVTDAAYVATMQARCAEILAAARALADEAGHFVDGKLLEMIVRGRK